MKRCPAVFPEVNSWEFRERHSRLPFGLRAVLLDWLNTFLYPGYSEPCKFLVWLLCQAKPGEGDWNTKTVRSMGHLTKEGGSIGK